MCRNLFLYDFDLNIKITVTQLNGTLLRDGNKWTGDFFYRIYDEKSVQQFLFLVYSDADIVGKRCGVGGTDFNTAIIRP